MGKAGDHVRVKVVSPTGSYALRDLQHGEIVRLVKFEERHWIARKANGGMTIVYPGDIDCVVEPRGDFPLQDDPKTNPDQRPPE